MTNLHVIILLFVYVLGNNAILDNIVDKAVDNAALDAVLAVTTPTLVTLLSAVDIAVDCTTILLSNVDTCVPTDIVLDPLLSIVEIAVDTKTPVESTLLLDVDTKTPVESTLLFAVDTKTPVDTTLLSAVDTAVDCTTILLSNVLVAVLPTTALELPVDTNTPTDVACVPTESILVADDDIVEADVDISTCVLASVLLVVDKAVALDPTNTALLDTVLADVFILLNPSPIDSILPSNVFAI